MRNLQIGVHKIKESLKHRSGSPKLVLGDLSISLIVLVGMVVNILLIYLGFIFNIEMLSRINFFLVIYNLIPLSDLDGTKIFFGSQLLWVFTLIFAILSYALLPVNFALALIVSIILAVTIVILFFVYWFYKGS